MQKSFDSGCATKAFEIRRYLEENDLPLHRIHSFGFRGHNSMENAIKAGKAWRLFLKGTDDFHTQGFTDGEGMSIPATAHKTIQQFDDEMEAYLHSIDATKANGFKMVAIVIDTYDPLRFIKYYAKNIAVYAKKQGVHVVFRPDSGKVMDQAFALYTIMSSHGLLENTSCIIGEGITFDKVKEYDKFFKDMGCALDWFNYGMGSGFYKDVDRDYLGFAMKTSYSNGENRMKFSADPFKQSIAGDVNLQIRGMDEYYATYDQTDSKYVKLYECGIDGVVPTWVGTKTRAESYLDKPIQEEINLSDSILEETERLRKKYITDVKVEYDTNTL